MANVSVSQFRKLSWEEVHENAKLLVKKLKEKGLHKSFKGILAISRGGLAPTAIIAQLMEIRMIETVSIVAYAQDDTNPSIHDQAKVIKPAANVGDGEGWLMIDDMVDTGKTAAVLRHLFPKAHFATIYAKPQGKPFADTFVEEVTQETWLYLPWELSEKVEL